MPLDQKQETEGRQVPGGYKHNLKSGTDSCTKSETKHQTPTWPADWDYKSQSDKDVCQDK